MYTCIEICVENVLLTVYDKRGYRNIVNKVSHESMQKAVEEVKELANYNSCGEVTVCAYETCIHVYTHTHVHVNIHV